MKTLFRALAALCLFASPVLAGWDIKEMNRQIDNSFFVVNDGCSGTLIKGGMKPVVLTAEHCIATLFEEIERETVDKDDGTVTTKKVKIAVPGKVVQLTFDGVIEVTAKSYRVRVLASDKKRDLAVVEGLSPIYRNIAKIGCVAPQRGEHITVVGNPKGQLYASVADGIVSSTQRSYRQLRLGDITIGNPDQGLVQISPGLVGGNSGGALYNDAGELVGVPVLAHPMNEVLGFAVPLDDIHAFLKSSALGQLIKHCPEVK